MAEALLVTVIGVALAFAANALSPRGLKLSQNYFLIGVDNFVTNQPIASAKIVVTTNGSTATNVAIAVPTAISAARLEAKGLQVVDGTKAFRFFQDTRREKGLLVFVDARNDEHYQAGHIPGAYQLDPYLPEKYLASAMAAGKTAEVIVVYCTGGECEDSELSALLLRNVGIPNQKLFVYTGGITDWTNNHFPIETGARKIGTAGETKP